MKLTILRPDDWHLHVRDDEAMQSVVPHTARQFGRAIIMPNLRPPVTSTDAALAYRHAARFELRWELATDSDAQAQPATGEDVEGRDDLCRGRGMPQRHQIDRGPQTNPFGHGRGKGEQRQRLQDRDVEADVMTTEE